MALDLTPSKMRREIYSSIQLRRDTTNQSRSLIRQYGEGGRETWQSGDEVFENHAFEWVANIVPHLVFTNPTVRVTDLGVQDAQTQMVQWGLRSAIQQTRMNLDLTACAYDIQFDFACGIVVNEPTPGFLLEGNGFTPLRPRLKRLSPRQVFRDARAPELGKPRFEGHIFVKDKNDMLAETVTDDNGNTVPKYDSAAVMELTDNDGLDELRKDLMQDGIFLADSENQVVCFEVYCHEAKCWLTLGFCSGDDARLLRTEREYRGPADGCYCWFGTYIVPDQVYPLANLAVTRKQVEEINKHRWQMSRDAAVAKQVGIVNGAAPGIVANIQDAKSGDILSLPGFTGVVNTMKFGGAMKETYEYVEFSKSMLDRMSGLSEMQRGNLTGVTATEAESAKEFVDVRLKYAQNRFKEDVSIMLGKMADPLYNNKSIAFPCMIEPEGGGDPTRGTFMGGQVQPPDPQYPWRPSLMVEIEPYSMEYVNQGQLREQMIAYQQQVVELLQAQMTLPMMNGRAMLNDLGQTMNMPRSADRYANWQMMMQILASSMSNGPIPKPPAESIGYKDIPPEAQAQMLAQAGIHIDPAVLAAHAAQQQQAEASKAAAKGAPGAKSKGPPKATRGGQRQMAGAT